MQIPNSGDFLKQRPNSTHMTGLTKRTNLLSAGQTNSPMTTDVFFATSTPSAPAAIE
jgi:hypothetical protein